MTENMAGRGEGLAGLVAELAALYNRAVWTMPMLPPQGWAKYGWNELVLPANAVSNITKRMKLALAAAPAGTAHDVHWAIKAQCAHCVDGYPQRQDGDGYISNLGPVSDGEWFHHGMVYSSSGVVQCAAQYIHEALRRAALATPSPQASAEQSNAFSPTSTREQSVATASSRLGVGDEVTWIGQEGKRFTERIRKITEPQPGNYVFWVGEDEFPVNHQEVERAAATQEQPAGSEARPSNEHELLVGGVVRAALELAILRGDLRMDSGDAFEEMSESEREDVISDTWNAMNGEGTCDDEPVKELKAIYVALGSPRKVGEDGALDEQLRQYFDDHRCTERMGPFQCWKLQGHEERCLFDARPSSVPVGEQKQEEGV